jgi:hypothetical protein
MTHERDLLPLKPFNTRIFTESASLTSLLEPQKLKPALVVFLKEVTRWLKATARRRCPTSLDGAVKLWAALKITSNNPITQITGVFRGCQARPIFTRVHPCSSSLSSTLAGTETDRSDIAWPWGQESSHQLKSTEVIMMETDTKVWEAVRASPPYTSSPLKGRATRAHSLRCPIAKPCMWTATIARSQEAALL